MIAFQVRGLKIRIHGSMLLMLALTSVLCGAAPVLIAAASLLVHEAGHAVAARVAGARFAEMELMPFGAAARIDDMHGISPAKAAAVALAGPAASAVLFLSSFLMTGELANTVGRVNLAIAAFNLIPALPLDGGRVMTRLAGCGLGAKKATGIGIAAGRVVAAAMIAVACIGAIETGRLNLTYIISAVYILTTGKRERLAASGGIVLGMLDRDEFLDKEGTMPVRWLAAKHDSAVDTILGSFKPGSVHRVAVYDKDMRLMGIVEEEMLLRLALSNKPAKISDALADGA